MSDLLVRYFAGRFVLVAGACLFVGSLLGLAVAAACSPTELATAKQDARKALDVACQARAHEKAAEAPDAGK